METIENCIAINVKGLLNNNMKPYCCQQYNVCIAGVPTSGVKPQQAIT